MLGIQRDSNSSSRSSMILVAVFPLNFSHEIYYSSARMPKTKSHVSKSSKQSTDDISSRLWEEGIARSGGPSSSSEYSRILRATMQYTPPHEPLVVHGQCGVRNKGIYTKLK
jgi:hypothetical protein